MTLPGKINFKALPGKAEMWSDSDGISWLVFAPGSEIDETDMQEILRLTKTTLEEGEEVLGLIDIRRMQSISNEARSLAADKEHGNMHKALAIVVSSTAMRLVANFFIHFHKPPRPVQIFSSPEEAKSWLLSFMK